MKRLILEIANQGHYFKPAGYIVLDLDEESRNDIRQQAGNTQPGRPLETSIPLSCRAANLDFTAPLDNGKIALKKLAGWMDAVHLTIVDDAFFLTGFYGYSDVHWRTAPVPLTALEDEDTYDMR